MLRLAQAVSGRRTKWITVVLWVALAAVFVPLQSRLAEVTADDDTGALPADTQSRQVDTLLAERFPPDNPPRASAIVVYHRDAGLTAADRQRILEDARRLQSVEAIVGTPVPGVAPLAPAGLVSQGGDTALTAIGFQTDEPAQLEEPIASIREIVQHDSDGLVVHVTGDAALEVDFEREFERGESRLLLVTATLVLVLLIVMFRSPVIALVPLAVVGIAYIIGSGLIYLLAQEGLQVTDVATALLLVLMFGAGTDYCLLLVARYTEALRKTEDHHHAIEQALPRAAPAMSASGVTVMVALLALLVADLGSTRTLGPVNAIGIALVLLAGLTLLPALLAIVGRRGFWPSGKRVSYERRIEEHGGGAVTVVAGTGGAAHRPAEREGFWHRLAVRVVKRPGLALALTTLAFGAGAVGLTSYESSADFLAQFRADVDSTKGFEVLRQDFPAGALAPITVVVERRDGAVKQADTLEVNRRLTQLGGLRRMPGGPEQSIDGRIVTLTYAFSADPYSNATLDRVPEIREALSDLGPQLRALVGESSAVYYDVRETAQRDLELVVPVILVVILVILMLLLRAVVAPLYLIATVILSFFGTLGISLLFFDVVLGEVGYDPQLPTFAFMFLVALGIDYNIFLMDRVREESRAHGTRAGLIRAVSATAPVITSAGIILAGTFAALLTLPITVLLEIGFAVALGVLLDTFVVRTILVPAIVQLVGDASWWPSRLSRPRDPPAPADVTRPAAQRPEALASPRRR